MVWSTPVSFVLVFLICLLVSGEPNDKKPPPESEQLPPCQACRTVVNSFIEGMLKTNKKHFGGGDTAYEEEKLGDYVISEVRLAEVQEFLCSDVKRGQNQCYSLADEWESLLEEWWPQQRTISDLFDWLCIKKVEHCCADNHYGPECKPCPGYPDNVCSNNGKCKGAGTKKGNGQCTCNMAYTGETCNDCAEGYYESYRDDKKLLCTKCHKSCKGACTRAGHKGCIECNPGWIQDGDRGCLDLNECASQAPPCSKDEFCVNNDGSYSCLKCDQSCDGCHGDGPDMCQSCAEGFRLKDGLCTPRQQATAADWTRYLTYFGLCAATFIIFQKNTIAASVIGLLVGMYVTVSEYMLSSPSADQNYVLQNSLNALFNKMK
uniref:Cysteine-rich with EGF-like domain protein 2 n=1 Tax=Lygus hesperus TaxID=30085 RepID=A0A0A9W637_LYGHE